MQDSDYAEAGRSLEGVVRQISETWGDVPDDDCGVAELSEKAAALAGLPRAAVIDRALADAGEGAERWRNVATRAVERIPDGGPAAWYIAARAYAEVYSKTTLRKE